MVSSFHSISSIWGSVSLGQPIRNESNRIRLFVRARFAGDAARWGFQAPSFWGVVALTVPWNLAVFFVFCFLP